jgi:hypothetical protein
MSGRRKWHVLDKQLKTQEQFPNQSVQGIPHELCFLAPTAFRPFPKVLHDRCLLLEQRPTAIVF